MEGDIWDKSSDHDLTHLFLGLGGIIKYENHDIAIAMSPSRADPVLPWLGLFKYLNQCH